MPIFTNPAALWGTIVFLGLIAVYIYRRRSRNIVLSTIMFFSKSKSTAEGGQKLHKLQTPLIFYLEVLIFLLLIMAIANPVSLHRGQLIPISIVLDDSLSMTAGGKNSAYNLCLSYLKGNIFSKSYYSITLIKASDKPVIIGRRDMGVVEAENTLKAWKCESVNSNLMVAVAHAIEMGTDETIILVLTDHLNKKTNSESIKWLSFGMPRENIAITSANRSANGRVDRCFFEFTNFSKKQKVLEAEILDSTNDKVLNNISTTLEPKSSRRVVLKIHEQSSTIKAKIKNDDITYDNEVILLPIKREKMKVALDFNNLALANAVNKAVLSTDMAVIDSKLPQIQITDKIIKAKDSVITQVVFPQASHTLSLVKNFAADKNDSITSDLPLENGIWVADSSFYRMGKTLLVSGNIPLICVDEDSNNWNTVYLNYVYNNSNMDKTTFWPVFFFNVLEWTSHFVPGPNSFNFRSGSQIIVSAEKESTKVLLKRTLENNKEEVKEGMVNNGKVYFQANLPGIYEIEDGNKKYKIAVNLCSYDESDLTKSERTKTYPEIVSDENLNYFESVKWWFILLAFLLMALHQWLISKRRVGYAF